MSASLPTCFHEAGHAVIAAHLGVRFFQVNVRRRSAHYNWRGRRIGPVAGSVTFYYACIAHLALGFEDWRDHVRQVLAGGLAERQYYERNLPGRQPYAESVKGDHEWAGQLFGQFNRDGTFSFGRARSEVQALVTELFPMIESVAMALRQRRELTEAEVVSICGMGERREPVLERFPELEGTVMPPTAA